MKYVAFLRAINVGGHVVKMDALRRVFEAAGFANVETFIASGNVIFDARTASVPKIEKALLDALAYEVRVFLRTPSDLARIGQTADAGGTLYIGFAATPAGEAAKRKVEALSTPDDEVRVDGAELYWLCRRKFSESKFSGALLEKALGQPLTLRNISTIRRIAAKYA